MEKSEEKVGFGVRMELLRPPFNPICFIPQHHPRSLDDMFNWLCWEPKKKKQTTMPTIIVTY
eukprot:3308336-Amphidinium_carterae.1